MWKTDRLVRDKYVLVMAKKTIREAGCEIHLLAENIPTDKARGGAHRGPDGLHVRVPQPAAVAEIQRGMDYNSAPFARRMFDE